MWIDLSQSRNVSRKPTNLNLVDKTKEMIDAKTILIYTPLWGSKPWPHTVPSWDGRATGSYDNKIHKYCPHVCRLTYNRNEFNKSHAVVFHGRDMSGVKELQELNSTKIIISEMGIFYSREPNKNISRLEGTAIHV